MTKTIVLREYEPLVPGEKIDKQEFKQIQKFVLQNQQQDRPVMTVGHDKLTAKNYVGILQTHQGTVIEILPKIDLGSEDADSKSTRKIFLQMLRALRTSPFREMDEADIRACKNLGIIYINP